MDVITGRRELSFGPLQVKENVYFLVQIDTRLPVFLISIQKYDISNLPCKMSLYLIFNYQDIPLHNTTQHDLSLFPGGNVYLNITASIKDDEWVAIAFSNDTLMGNDDVVAVFMDQFSDSSRFVATSLLDPYRTWT